MLGMLLFGISLGITRSPTLILASEVTLIRFDPEQNHHFKWCKSILDINNINFRLRGATGGLNILLSYTGHLGPYIVAEYLPVKFVPMAVAVLCVVFILFSWAMVESPVWLMKQGRADECENVIKALRGPNYHYADEVKEIQMLIGKEKGFKGGTKSHSFVYPLFLSCSLFFFHAAIGVDDITEYSLIIFKYPGVILRPYVITIIFLITFPVGSLLGPLLMTKVGRRPQLIFGGNYLRTTLKIVLSLMMILFFVFCFLLLLKES